MEEIRLKLSMWTLHDWLDKQGLAPMAKIIDDQPLLESVTLFMPDHNPDDAVQILTGRQAELGEGCATVLRFGRDIIQIPKRDLAVVHNEVLACLKFYNNWEKELLICLIEGKSLQDMLEAAHSVFQRPMFIKSDSSWVFAITKGYDASVHPDWFRLQESVISRQADFNAVKAVSLDPEFQLVFSQKYPCIMFSPFYGGEVLHANVWLKERRICEIITIANGRPFNRGEPHLMYFFAQMLHRVIQADSPLYLSHSGLATFFVEMLETGEFDPLNLAAVRHTLGWQENDELAVFCVEIQAGSDTPILSVLREKLVEQFKNGCAFSYRGRVVCIVNTTKGGGYQQTLKTIASIIPPGSFIWGVSFEFTGLDNFPIYYRQASAVLAYARERKQAHLTMYQTALQMAEEQFSCLADSAGFTHPDIRRLQKADLAGNSQYMRTLFEFLFNGGNYTDAAHTLGLHRNSLIYRINRIRELMHSDLDDPENKKVLLLSYLFSGERLKQNYE